jgi:hypothetical protein
MQEIIRFVDRELRQAGYCKTNLNLKTMYGEIFFTGMKLADELQKGLTKAVILHLLGHALLCGVLHVTYSTSDKVTGQYMICVLYRSSLVLAVPSRGFTTYAVVGVVSLANGSVEGSDNGRGWPVRAMC